MRATALIVTADSARWARQAALNMTGFATSVIGCGCEAGIDRPHAGLGARRPTGVRALQCSSAFTQLVDCSSCRSSLLSRVAQCMCSRSPRLGTAMPGLAGEEKLRLGRWTALFRRRLADFQAVRRKAFLAHPGHGRRICLRGHDRSAQKGGRWRQSSRDRSYFADDARGGRGCGQSDRRGAEDVDRAVPGRYRALGLQDQGSKYKGVQASTNDAYCPTLRGAVNSALDAEAGSVLEIVIDGVTSEAVAAAMRAGIASIIKLGPQRGATRISAGNYGGSFQAASLSLAEGPAAVTLVLTFSACGGFGPAPRSFAAGPASARRQDRRRDRHASMLVDDAGVRVDRRRSVQADAWACDRITGRYLREICERLDGIGAGMMEGEIEVAGDVGIRAGRLMSGGRLTIRGNAGPWSRLGDEEAGSIEIIGGRQVIAWAALSRVRWRACVAASSSCTATPASAPATACGAAPSLSKAGPAPMPAAG